MSASTLTRLIGPIRTTYSGMSEPDPGHPKWTGYAPVPVPVPLSWLAPEVQHLVTQPGTCWGPEGRSLRGEIFRAETSDTLLIYTDGEWFIACPARRCRRAIGVAIGALRDGESVPQGLLDEEIAEAQRIAARRTEPQEDEMPTLDGEPLIEGVNLFFRRQDEE